MREQDPAYKKPEIVGWALAQQPTTELPIEPLIIHYTSLGLGFALALAFFRVAFLCSS